MNENELLTTFNQLDRDSLIALPGIGATLAERILAARPFETLEQVQNVKGIRTALIEKLLDEEAASPSDPKPASVMEAEATPQSESPLPAVDDESLPEEEQPARKRLGDRFSGLGNPFKKREQAEEPALDASPEKRDDASGSQNPVWRSILNGLWASIFTVLFTLLILAGINGSLQFATKSDYHSLQQDVTELSARSENLQTDLDGLRGRVDTLEGLGERTVTLEKEQQQLAAGLNTATEQVNALNEKVLALDEKVSQQDERTQRFETFLTDLQTSLGKLFAPQGE